MKKILLNLIFIQLLIFFLSSAHATSLAILPEPSRIYFSENRKLVFVKWGDDGSQVITPNGNDKIKFASNEFSLANYPQSGLYEIKGRKFLWTPSTLTDFDQYKPLNDKKHLITYDDSIPYYGSPIDYNVKVLGIYSQGKEIKSFPLKDFCTRNELMKREDRLNAVVSLWVDGSLHFEWAKQLEIDNLNQKLVIKSCNILYAIDVDTGSVSKKYLLPTLKDLQKDKILAFSALMLLLSPVLIFLRFYMVSKNKGTPKQRQIISGITFCFIFAFPLAFLSPIIMNKIITVIFYQ